MAKKRISKRTREQAALTCAIAASTPRRDMMGYLFRGNPYDARDAIGASRPALNLAYQALGAGDSVHAVAEAEAMLRTGWSP